MTKNSLVNYMTWGELSRAHNNMLAISTKQNT